jgi:sensor histidine kinase YesM
MKKSSDIVYERVIENASLSLSQVALNLDNKLESYELIPNTLFLNDKLDAIIEKRYDDYGDAYAAYSEYYQPFISAVRATKDIAHMNLYTSNDTFLFGDVLPIDDEVRSSSWYPNVIHSHSGGYWTGPYTNPTEHTPVFSFRKRLNNFVASSTKVVSLEIKLKVLYDLIGEESKSKRYVFALADGTVMVDSSADHPVQQISELPFYERIRNSPEGGFPYEVDGEPYRILYKTLDSRNLVKGMKVVAFVPIAELMPRVEQLRSLAILLFLIAFVVSALLISVISVGMTRRLTELSYRMKRVHRDNFQSFVEVKGKDEVAQLGEMFNGMVRRVGQLIHEMYVSELDKKEKELRTKEVELYALQTQIHPHFLFNVLNTIRGKLLIAGERETAKVVGLLAKSFRMMLRTGGQTVKLADELEFVDSYLQIQQYRFADKFTYEIDLPPELRGAYVPKLCVQPLVENAVSHGVELNPTPSCIRIAASRLEEKLRIEVSDDGLGISPGRLKEIEGWLRAGALEGDSHIGLRNVNRRLKSLYGEAYGLSVESAEGQGTRVTITIPWDDEGGGAEHA